MRKYSFENSPILYLVATPIGNLEDITFRAIRILKEVDRIYAEDTRNSSFLLKHYDINTPLYSYHEYNQNEKSEAIINYIKDGHNVAIISDAGLPVISDPGFKLIDLAVENDISVVTIPGASAGISAFVSSGLPTPFTFYGFLKPKKEQRKKELEKLKYLEQTLIFYEAPHRIKETVEDILNVFGNRKCVLARELTKKFEEYIRCDLEELLTEIDNIKGELVLLVAPYIEESITTDKFTLIEEQISLGLKPKEAIKDVANMLNLNKQELYKEYIEYKKERENEN